MEVWKGGGCRCGGVEGVGVEGVVGGDGWVQWRRGKMEQVDGYNAGGRPVGTGGKNIGKKRDRGRGNSSGVGETSYRRTCFSSSVSSRHF